MGNVYTLNAPAGIPGDVTRKLETLVEPIMLGAAIAAFGVPVKFNGSGKAIAIAASDTAAVFKGILSRSVPTISGSTVETFAGGVPNVETVQGIVRKGYVAVLCTIGTPVKGGTVYMRVVAASGKAVGDLEATADGTDNVALVGVEWAVNGKDADNITELFIK